MAGSDKVLVYHHRHNGSPVVRDGLAAITKSELDNILNYDTGLQWSVKSIPRGAMAVDIHQHDLLTSLQASTGAKYPNADANVAGVKLPLSVTLGSALSGKYSELVILSKKR